jgi:hypothetical protein
MTLLCSQCNSCYWFLENTFQQPLLFSVTAKTSGMYERTEQSYTNLSNPSTSIFQRSDYHVNLFTTIFLIISNIADILSN